jgi:hypothetical protein
MKKFLFFSLILLLGFAFQTLDAQEIQSSDSSSFGSSEKQHQRIGLGIGLKASTFGLGGEVVAAITPKIHVRLGGTYLKYSLPESLTSMEDIKSSNEFIFGGISLFGNYHITRIFFVSAGAIYNMIEADVQGAPSRTVAIGAIDATPEQVGSLSLHIEPTMKVCPYLGLGLGRTIATDGIFSFAFEAGAAFIGQPKVSLNATGMLTPTGSAEQQQTLEDNLSFIKITPMISIQLSIRII